MMEWMVECDAAQKFTNSYCDVFRDYGPLENQNKDQHIMKVKNNADRQDRYFDGKKMWNDEKISMRAFTTPI